MNLFDFIIPTAAAQDAAQQGNPTFSIIIFGGLFVLMYFLIIRPQRKRQKEHRQLVDGLAVGDEVVLSSGLVGKITKINEQYVHLSQGDDKNGVIYQKIAVHAVLPKGTIKSIK